MRLSRASSPGEWRSEGAPRGLPLFVRGFTLVETLIVLAILGVCTTISLVARPEVTDTSSPAHPVVRESEAFASWMRRVFTRASMTGRYFYMRPGTQPVSRIRVFWTNPDETEVYDTDERCFIANRGAYRDSWYSPVWNTFSPSFTLMAFAERRGGTPVRYIVVTPYCLVSVRNTPLSD